MTIYERVDGKIQRPGIDHDPITPWMWATMSGRGEPVEILSYPVPARGDGPNITERATIMVRLTVGDCTTLREVPLRLVGCFSPDRYHAKEEAKQRGRRNARRREQRRNAKRWNRWTFEPI